MNATPSSTDPYRTPIGRDDVFAACDALLQAGARPTGDAVRAHLGRGSPNTIHPLIGEWWKALSARIATLSAPSRPDVPEPLWEAGQRLWEAALAAAAAHASAAIAAAQADAEQRVAAARTSEDEAIQSRDTARVETASMKALLHAATDRADASSRQVGELTADLQNATARTESTTRELATARAMLTQLREQHDADRIELNAQHAKDREHWQRERDELRTSTERERDRLMTQVDIARQDVAGAQRKIERLESEVREQSRTATEVTIISAQQARDLAASAVRERTLEDQVAALKAQLVTDAKERKLLNDFRDLPTAQKTYILRFVAKLRGTPSARENHDPN